MNMETVSDISHALEPRQNLDVPLSPMKDAMKLTSWSRNIGETCKISATSTLFLSKIESKLGRICVMTNSQRAVESSESTGVDQSPIKKIYAKRCWNMEPPTCITQIGFDVSHSRDIEEQEMSHQDITQNALDSITTFEENDLSAEIMSSKPMNPDFKVRHKRKKIERPMKGRMRGGRGYYSKFKE
jgi:hypothetical protein